MGTNPAKLMYNSKSAENGMVTDMHMPRNLCIVGENGMAANLTVMRHVNISHDPVAVTHSGNASVLGSAAVKGTKFTKGIVIADFQAGRLIFVFLVLWRLTDGTELKKGIARTNSGIRSDNDMWTDARA